MAIKFFSKFYLNLYYTLFFQKSALKPVAEIEILCTTKLKISSSVREELLQINKIFGNILGLMFLFEGMWWAVVMLNGSWEKK